MKNITTTTWAESNSVITVEIKVGKEFNIYNYTTSDYTMKAANILTAGGTIVINNIPHKVTDQDVIEHFQLQQLDFLIHKYNKVTGDGAILARKFFTSRPEAKAFFASPSWAQQKARHFKLNALEVLVPTLMAIQEQVLLEQAFKESKRTETRLNIEMIRAGVKREDLTKDLPNQGVTTAIAPAIEAQQKLGETGPYVTFTGNYTSTTMQVIESRIVNTWLYNQPEFRVPSKEDQANELEQLREWFQDLKEVARTFGEAAFRAEVAEHVTKYERLETLEIEVGTYLNDRVAAHILY